MNISYIDFWAGFDKNHNWFNPVFRDVLNRSDINFNSPPEEADIIVSSTFNSDRLKYKDSKALKIFYTGENMPPDLENCDIGLSFEYDSYSQWKGFKRISRNFRLPHWYLYVNWWDDLSQCKETIFKKDLTHKWDIDSLWNRPHFCSLIIGNVKYNRLDVADKLGQITPVHAYGRAFNNPFTGSKIELLKNFKYNICFENTIKSGYVTEKLLEAKVAGCIPIYYGHEDVRKDFNTKSFINYYLFPNDSEKIRDYVIEINKNKDLFAKIASQPLFNKPPNLDKLYKFLSQTFKNKNIL
jgi:hypothetical protein